jgi:hypothetical protein
MPRVSKSLLRCVFLIACFAGLLFSITDHGEDTKEAGNGDAKFRRLLGLDGLRPRQKQQQLHGHEVSPAPVPARAHLPLLHKDARLPVPGKVAQHEKGNAAAHSRSGGEQGSKRKSTQLFVVAAAAALIGAAAVLVVVLVVFLVCRKLRGGRGGAEMNGTNKVSSEPAGTCVFYPDTTVKLSLEAGQDGGGKAPAPEVARTKEDERAKCGEEDADEPKSEVEDGDEEPKREEEEDDGAESVYSSCCFPSSHFSYSELRDAKHSFDSPSPSSRWKRRTSTPVTPSDKIAVASPRSSSLRPRTPGNEDRIRRVHSLNSSMSASTLMLLNDHEGPGSCRSVKSLRFQSFRVGSVKEDEAERENAGSKDTSSTTAPPPPPGPPPPPPPPPPAVVKQEQHVQTSRGPAGPPPPPPPMLAPLQKNVQTGSGPGHPPPPAPPTALFRQSAPLGQNGAPLPKLKPLHWDKVRAAPNRRMVWDRIRSSSFE